MPWTAELQSTRPVLPLQHSEQRPRAVWWFPMQPRPMRSIPLPLYPMDRNFPWLRSAFSKLPSFHGLFESFESRVLNQCYVSQKSTGISQNNLVCWNFAHSSISTNQRVYDDNTAYKLTLTALEVGYRNFFASVLAGNQRGFAKAIRDSNVPRKDL